MKEKQAERLLELMSQLPDELLEEAIDYQKPAVVKTSWNKGSLIAACFGVFLISGLLWGTLRDPMGENIPTEAGIAAGGAENVTLASTTPQEVDPTGSISGEMQGFWYDQTWYVGSINMVTELPADYEYQGSLYYQEPTTEPETHMADWLTDDDTLDGAKVYGKKDDPTGFYVETEVGYVYFGREESQDE